MDFSIRYALDELSAVATRLLEHRKQCRLYCFEGDLGLGKTTLIREMCLQLGVSLAEISSPTFPIINEYKGAEGLPIYHMDFYRIQHTEEGRTLDIDYYFSSFLCLVEWPKFAQWFSAYPHCWVSLAQDEQSETKRQLSGKLIYPSSRYA